MFTCTPHQSDGDFNQTSLSRELSSTNITSVFGEIKMFNEFDQVNMCQA